MLLFPSRPLGAVLSITVLLLSAFSTGGLTIFPEVPGSSDTSSSMGRHAPVTYHVGPTGLDTNDGSALAPFREIRKALTGILPGDVVLVSNGTYLGFDVDGIHGNANAWITIKAPEHNATINVTTDRGDNRDTIYITGSSFIILDGLKAFNANRAAMRISQSNNITVRNATFGNNAVWGIFTDFSDDTTIEDSELYGSGSQHGIYFSNSPDRPIARNNSIHDNYGCGIHNNGDISMGGDGLVQGALLEGNTIYNNGAGGGSGINMDGPQDAVIRNNVLYNNHASGIALYDGDASSGPRNVEVYHNTIDMPSDGRYALQIQGSVGPLTVRNNILYNRNPTRGGLTYGAQSDIDNTDSDYNIMDRMSPDDWATLLTLAQWQAQGHEAHSFSATPVQLWTDASNGNYHLLKDSPAVDNGTTLATVKNDRDGMPRPSGTASDIGAYEWQNPIPPDTTPPGAVLDLWAGNTTLTSADLRWNATGDDGKVGKAAGYDLRYSTANINNSSWATANKVIGLPAPLPAGSAQSFTVTGLAPNTKYYFAIKASDERNNTAILSNIASATTQRMVPDLAISPSDIAFSNSTPMEGNNVTVTATIHSINITEELMFFVEMRVDGAKVPGGNMSVKLNATSKDIGFNWTTVKGTHNITIELDTASAIKETNKANNLAIRMLVVSPKPLPPVPDLFLIPDNVGFWPWSFFVGGAVYISTTVHSKNITSDLLVDITLTVDWDEVDVQTVTVNGTDIKVFFDYPTNVKGNHTVVLKVDPWNAITETNETNNVATRRLYVSPPDAVMKRSDIVYDNINDIYEGDNVKVIARHGYQYVVSNKTMVVHFLVDGALKENRSFKLDGIPNELVFYWTAISGTHSLTVRLDVTDVLDEDNETNNEATAPIMVHTLAEKYPLDLIVRPESIQLSEPELKQGKQYLVTAYIDSKNRNFTVPITVEMLIDYVPFEKKSMNMTANSISIGFNWTPTSGIHNITIKVTADKSINEPDKTNNMATKIVSVLGKPKKPHNDEVDRANMIGWTIAIVLVVAAVAAILFYVQHKKNAKK